MEHIEEEPHQLIFRERIFILTNLILCGGNGTRLWPISRTLMPKQFVKILNNKSKLKYPTKKVVICGLQNNV
mgnify:CR=1 FL=1